jgi:hypothetical protein
MLWQKEILQDLFQTVENIHKVPFWKAFCRCIDTSEVFGMSASEYEIYFNFVFSKTDQMKIRPLQWRSISELRLPHYKKQGYDFVKYQEKRSQDSSNKGVWDKMKTWFSKRLRF